MGCPQKYANINILKYLQVEFNNEKYRVYFDDIENLSKYKNLMSNCFDLNGKPIINNSVENYPNYGGYEKENDYKPKPGYGSIDVLTEAEHLTRNEYLESLRELNDQKKRANLKTYNELQMSVFEIPDYDQFFLNIPINKDKYNLDIYKKWNKTISPFIYRDCNIFADEIIPEFYKYFEPIPLNPPFDNNRKWVDYSNKKIFYIK
jgi:hypothetical protein